MNASSQSIPGQLLEQRVAPAVVLALCALALLNLYLSPDEAGRWLRPVLFLPSLWIGLTWWHVRTLRSMSERGVEDVQAVTRYFRSVLALVFLALGIRQGAAFALEIHADLFGSSTDYVLERRVLGIAMGAMFMVIGNALPKILTPASMLPLALSDRVSRARRFIGRTWFAFGLVLVLAFLLGSLELASKIQPAVVILCIACLLGAIVWMNAGPKARAP